VSGDILSQVRLREDDDHEELARAEVYGVLAQLFHAPPGEELYAQLRVAVTEAPAKGAFLERSWSGLVAAARRLDRTAVAAEYADLFLGVGKPEVFLYGSFYVAGSLHGKPLVTLRGDLQKLGLERAEEVSETEDHIASLCEVMRYLIAGDDIEVSNLEQQRRFFRAQVQPWIEALCKAVDEQPAADLWRAVAAMTLAFVQVETQAFDLLEA
jgi:TorA maturation chaperone TorD